MSFEFTDRELDILQKDEDVLSLLLEGYEDAIGFIEPLNDHKDVLKEMQDRAEEIQKQINHVKYINSESFE